MSEPMRLLIVEDAPADAEMAERVIRKAGWEFVSLRVETRDDFIRAIGGFKPDLILSDYSLPHFDGMSALRIAQEMAPGVPFIIITGSINEETAVACMRAGADDYILKDRLARLAPCIQGALASRRLVAEKREAEKLMKASELRYRRLFEAARDGIVILDAETGCVVDSNPFVQELLGYSAQEVIGKSIWDLGPFKGVIPSGAAFAKLIEKKYTRYEDLALEARDGTKRDVEFVSTVYPVDGRLVIQCNIRDISERKRAEEALRESEAQLRFVTDHAPVLIAHCDHERRYRFVNQAYAKMFGLRPEDLAGKNVRDVMGEEAYAHAGPHIDVVLRGETDEYELELPATPGAPRTVHVVYAPERDESDRVVGFLAGITDITARIRAEEALRESEQRFRILFEQSPDGVLILDPATARPLEFNEAAHRQLGYSREEFARLSVADIDADEAPDETKARIAGVVNKGREDFEARHRTRDGEIRYMHVSAKIIELEERPLYLCVWRDITDQKQTAAALRESEQRLSFALESNRIGAWDLNLLDHTAKRTLTHDQIFGYETLLPSWTYEMFLEHVLPEDRSAVDRHFYEAKAARSEWNFECRIRRADGEVRWIWAIGGYPRNSEGEHVWMTGLVQDITERKAAEAALRESQASYRTLAENLPGIVYHLTLGELGKMTFVNDMVRVMTGFSPAELTEGEVCSIEPLIVPEDREGVMRTVERAIERQKPFEVEYRVKHKDGGIRYFLERGRPGRGSQGECGWIDGIILDETERKQAQILLRTSELKFRTIFEGALDGIALTDLETQRLSAGNSAMCNMLGYTPEEFVQLGVADLHTQEDWPQVLETFEKQARGELALAENTPVKRKDGSVFYADIQTSTVTLGGRNYILGIFRDVTERREAEASRDLLTRAMEQSHDAIIITDREGSIVYTNPAFEKVTGYSSEEVRGKNPRILKSGLYDRAFYEEMWRILLAGHSWRGQMTNQRKDGSLFTEESVISPVRDRHGEITAFVAAKRDLTEEMHLQTRLAQARNLETIGLIAGGVAHEVRNPLFAITTIATALERKLTDQPDFGQYVAHIKEQASQLNQLMNDLLILGRPVENSAFVSCALGDILDGAQRQCAAGDASPREWLVDSPKEPLRIMGDQGRLTQVFQNILSNALAFSPDASPVRIRLWPEDGMACLSVADAGAGIPEELLPRLYQPFASKRKGGTGLGLAIVHKIVGAHGGTIEARNNDPPPGATFTVRLPLAEASKETDGESVKVKCER